MEEGRVVWHIRREGVKHVGGGRAAKHGRREGMWHVGVGRAVWRRGGKDCVA